jgi:hypothetical protein
LSNLLYCRHLQVITFIIEDQTITATITTTITATTKATMMTTSSLQVYQGYSPSQILKKIQLTRRGLQYITSLCDQLSNQVERWSSPSIMTHLLVSSSNIDHYSVLISKLELAIQCVELIVSSNSAIITFFHTFLHDFDQLISKRNFPNVNRDDDDNVDDDSSSFLSATKTMIISWSDWYLIDDMATTAVQFSKRLQHIATLNHSVLQVVETVMSAVLSPKNVDHGKNNNDQHDDHENIGTSEGQRWPQDNLKYATSSTLSTKDLLKETHPKLFRHMETLNHHVPESTERMVKSCLVSNIHQNDDHGRIDVGTTVRSKDILQDMHQRLAVGLMMVAELALKWNQRTPVTP